MISSVIGLGCLSRGGSNVLAGMMHCHPNVYSAARREWDRHRVKREHLIKCKPLWKVLKKNRKSIYFEGGHAKDMESITHLTLDKVYEKMYVTLRTDIVPESVYNVILIRNPFAVTASRHRFGLKYNWKGGIQTPEKARKSVLRFEALLKFARTSPSCLLLFEDLVKNPVMELSRVFKWCKLPEFVFTSFSDVFENLGCVHCGLQFTKKKTNTARASQVQAVRKGKFQMADHYFCSKCGAFTLGYGGFNPCKGVVPPVGWEEALPKKLRKVVFKVLTNRCGASVARAFLTNEATVEMLK